MIELDKSQEKRVEIEALCRRDKRPVLFLPAILALM